MSNVKIAVCILMTSVLISAISQIMLKKSTLKEHKSLLSEYVNPYVIIAYGFFFLSTLLTMFSLRYLPLSMVPILESSSYIFVSAMGYFFLKEKFPKKKLIGILVILVGIAVFSF